MSAINDLQDWKEGPSPDIHYQTPAEDSYRQENRRLRFEMYAVMNDVLNASPDGIILFNFLLAFEAEATKRGKRQEAMDFRHRYLSNPSRSKVTLLEAANALVTNPSLPVIRKPTEDRPYPVYAYCASRADIASYISNAARVYERNTGSIFCPVGAIAGLSERALRGTEIDFAVFVWFLHRAKIESSREFLALRQRELISRSRQGKIGVQGVDPRKGERPAEVSAVAEQVPGENLSAAA